MVMEEEVMLHTKLEALVIIQTENHLGTKPSEYPNFVSLTQKKRIDVAFTFKICITCLNPDTVWTPVHKTSCDDPANMAAIQKLKDLMAQKG